MQAATMSASQYDRLNRAWKFVARSTQLPPGPRVWRYVHKCRFANARPEPDFR
jgi:hypothetical protein